MKRVLVFRHVPHESLGTIEFFLNPRGFQIEFVDLFLKQPIPKTPQEFDFIIAMGGPMNVDEIDRYPFLKEEREFIKQAIGLGKPVLGVCLGAQMIARALDARVYAGPKKEIGWYPLHLSKEATEDPVFQHLEAKPTVFQWHGDTFDLPKGAVPLAASDLYPNQAFRFGTSVYALQFHVEVTAEMIQDWLLKGADELKSIQPPVSGKAIIHDARWYEPCLRSLADQIYKKLFQSPVLSAARH
ncbi:MAG: glutamine amidotransferase [Candidatus Omnitrophica bacterium]|nr:glutamine amidotransferase [Candidatus Omnitrophota bacterium]